MRFRGGVQMVFTRWVAATFNGCAFEYPVEITGDVSLQTAPNLWAGLALGATSRDVRDGVRIVA